jgi:hypothetical protein
MTKDKKEKKDKPKKKEQELKDKNMIRKISTLLQPYIQGLKGLYYGSLHLFIMTLCGTIMLFNNNIYHLILLLNIVIVDAACCVFIHDCPLTILEKKYLGHSLVGTRMFFLENMGILYQCDHIYEITIEFLTNMGSLITGKIALLIVLQMFDIKFVCL